MKMNQESERVGLKLNIQKTKIMTSSPITSWQIDGETVVYFIFMGSKISVDGDCSHEIKTLAPCMKSYDPHRHHIKKQRYYFAKKRPSSQVYSFSSSHVWMWEFEYKESWVLKKWCLWTLVLQKTLERPLNCREFQPVDPKGNQSWKFIGRTDAEAKIPVLWPADGKYWLIWKRPWYWERWKSGGEVENRG